MPAIRHAASALALTGLLAAPAAAQTWDARADFSPTTNPNGAWTYGYATAVGTPGAPAAVTVHTSTSTTADVHSWFTSGLCGDNTPAVAKNLGATAFTYGGSGNIGAGELVLHPGCSNQYSVVRFTAPAAGFTPGAYDLMASFRGADIGYRTIGLYLNGSALFEDFLNGGATASWTGARVLAAGDVVDLVVGAAGDYRFDQTGANLTISAVSAPVSAVPEPGTWALLATGLVAVGSIARRRRVVAG
ncbi:PEP-CTERM sorting domain-containing protein [Roseisolibacter agri]|uniref:Ice-binding protein C-terminal domain-containing protein n=1 Tax=Roseisolibacter agri TaxID=2014610 RepID=A0AA37VFD7_9BACT|nr:PEP-CTERM sorting domain-containing protein [Roseisolibacter agri]GLC26714.1 hypothetical protein rosag_32270 [Roseisolibacter agri]